MNERYIAINGGIFGEWGAGATIDEAKSNWRKAGGKVKNGELRIWKFTSELPFAPNNREANENEADAYVSRDGCMNWIRCKREEVEVAPAKKAKAKR